MLVSIFYALYCHRLNLVVVDTCFRNVTTRNIFGIVEKLYAFIEGSMKRHGLFQDVQKRLHGYDGSQAQNESAIQLVIITRVRLRRINRYLLLYGQRGMTTKMQYRPYYH